MTLSKNSDLRCPHCNGNRIVERPARPMPWLLQTLFAVSFVAFLIVSDRKWLTVWFAPIWAVRIVWVWSAIQIILGVLLARARFQARGRIFRCLACGATVS